MAINESYNFDDATFQGWSAYAQSGNVTIAVNPIGSLNNSENGIQIKYLTANSNMAYITEDLQKQYSDIYFQFRFKIKIGSGPTTQDIILIYLENVQN